MFRDLNPTELLAQFKTYMESHGEVIFKIPVTEPLDIRFDERQENVIVSSPSRTLSFERLPDTQDYILYQSDETPPLLVAFMKTIVVA